MDTNAHELARELAAETVRKFGKITVRVTGDSMLPALWPGDVITVVRQPLSRFRAGDIALAARRAGGRLEFVAHRVVRRQGGHLITQGDSLASADPPVQENEILGRIVAVTRRGRTVNPALTPARRLTAWLLRRSSLGSRVLLRLSRLRVG